MCYTHVHYPGCICKLGVVVNANDVTFYYCDAINVSHKLSVIKHIFIVDLCSDNMHIAPFKHLRNVLTNSRGRLLHENMRLLIL